MKILAYRFSAFGDVAMLAAVLSDFLKQNPDVEIIMVSRKNFQPLFKQIERLSFHAVELNHYKGIIGLWKLYQELKKQYQVNYVVDFHDVLRTKILNFFFSKSGFVVSKIEKGRKEKKELVNIWNLEKKQLKRTIERYADALRKLGFECVLSDELPKNNSQKEGVGFAPFARHQGKQLPLNKAHDFVMKLAKRKKVYLFGGKGKEADLFEKWALENHNIINLAGILSLEEELEKIRSLECMISMDSANMHLASLVGTRCISVWGQTHPDAGFLGYGQKEEDVVQVEDLSCRPCSIFGNEKCFRGDWACLEEIDTDKIIEKIK